MGIFSSANLIDMIGPMIPGGKRHPLNFIRWQVFGVDDEVLALCDGALEIPQAGTKHSFNVSVAGAIVIWELYRKLSHCK